MIQMIMNKVFKTFFNIYDTNGIYHDGFVQAMDLSQYSSMPIVNDVTKSILDSYIYNEFAHRVMLARWKEYLVWNKNLKRFEIKPEFYATAVGALYVYLAKSDKFFALLSENFKSISVTELETINHGQRVTGKVYGEALKTNVFDKVVLEIAKGTETENRGAHTDNESKGAHTDNESLGAHTDNESKGAHTDTETRGSHTDTENLGTHTDNETRGAHTDNESVGAQTNSSTKTNSIYPFDAVAFVPDSKEEDSTSNGAQSNSTSYGQQANSMAYGAQSNSNVYGSQENSNVYGAQSNSMAYGAQSNSMAYGAQSNSMAYGAQENTRTYGKTTEETKTRTDTETRGAHTDSETVSSYIDSKTRTKVVIISPEKYFEIQKELSDKNAYTLFAQAIDDCFLNNCFDFQALEKWGCIL